jgi:predicted dehydrogenase
MQKAVRSRGNAREILDVHPRLVATYRDGCELVAFCDTNPARMNFYNRAITATFGFPPVRTYPAKDFDRMIRGAQPDAVIVGTMDCTHHLYIIRAMELDREVITEKPLTIDVENAAQSRNR